MTIGLDISVLNDRQRVGIAVYTYNLIDALLKINKKDKFILFGIATFETFDYLKNLPFKNYPNVEMKIYRMPARFFRTAFLLWQWFDKLTIENFVGPVDIFHSFNWYFPPQRKGKRVGTVYDLTPLIYPQFHYPKTSQLDRVRLERTAKMADLVVAISKNSKKDFLSFWPTENVEVIYPAASDRFKLPKNNPKIKEVLRKYKLKPGYILSVATLEPRKNLNRLIEAYFQSGLENKLVLVGGMGWKNDQVLDMIKKHSDKIVLTGFVMDEDLPMFYSQALCFVYPSLYEGFGIPVLEAMSCGTPVICSKTSSLPEVGGDAAVYVDPKSVDSIAQALIKIKQRQLRIKLIEKGLKQAQKFSWRKSAEKLNKLYQYL